PDVSKPAPGQLALGTAERFLGYDRGTELDLLVRVGAVDHDRRGSELVPTVENRHLRGELRQEDRLLHRGVAAADDNDLLVAVERGVTDGAVRDSATMERALGLEVELASGRARGDDHGLGAVLLITDRNAEG